MPRKRKNPDYVSNPSDVMQGIDNLCQKATNCVNGVCCYLNNCFHCPPSDKVTQTGLMNEIWALGKDHSGGG